MLKNDDVKPPAKIRRYRSIHSPFSVFQSDLIRLLLADGLLSIDRRKNRFRNSNCSFLISNNTAIAFKYFGQAKLTRGTASQSSASRYNASYRPINRAAAGSSEYRCGEWQQNQWRESNPSRRGGEYPYPDRW